MNWHRTLRQTKVIIIDEMRTLLELHYDDVHLQRWRAKHADSQKKMPDRMGTHKVFASVAQTYRKKLNQCTELPGSVKAIFRCPEDETDWRRLDDLRRAICRIIEGEREVHFESRDEVEELATHDETRNSVGCVSLGTDVL